MIAGIEPQAKRGGFLETKEELREFFLNFRSNLGREQLERASIAIKNRFFKLDEVRGAIKFMVYYSYRNEVSTHGLIKRLLVDNKEVYLPYCLPEKRELRISPINNLDSDLITGTYGINEPKIKLNSPIEELDVVVVPGLAFARDGYRIGYGGGYYDRLISCLPEKTKTIGLIFHSLLVESLPFGRYDQPVDIVVTEREVIYTGGEDD